MVLEGRYGQGWSHFISEVCWANSSISGKKGVNECKKVLMGLVRRSYAEVAGLQNCVSSLQSSMNEFFPAKHTIEATAGLEQLNSQAKGSKDTIVEKERIFLAGSDSKNTNLISYPLVTGTKILKGWGTAGLERQALLRVNFKLQNIKKSLTKMRGEVDGINKIEEAMQFLDIGGSSKTSGPNMGFTEKGKEVEGGVGLDVQRSPDGSLPKRYKKKKE